MRRVLLLLGLAAATIAHAADTAGAPRLAVDIGVVPRVGVLYAGALDPGMAGLGLAAGAGAAFGLFVVDAGVEASSAPLGWQVLFPVRAGVRLSRGTVEVDVLGEGAPGVALTRPVLFAAALGAVVRVAWNVAPGFALTASVGARYTVVPGYAAFAAADASTLDIPLSLGVRLRPRSIGP